MRLKCDITVLAGETRRAEEGAVKTKSFRTKANAFGQKGPELG